MNSFSLFFPGRLCLFGEHSDWAGGHRRSDPAIPPGMCLITGTDQGVSAEITRAASVFRIASMTPDGESMGDVSIPMTRQALDDASRRGGFERYAAGVAAEILSRWKVGGIEIVARRMDLPLRKGLSSSAAICVLTARAFNRAYDLGLSLETEMELAYRGELRTGSECGRMDQACAFGATPTLLSFDGDQMTVERIRPPEPLYFLIVDLAGEKDTVRILADLNRIFLNSGDSRHVTIREGLGGLNREIVRRARAAVERGDREGIGELMTEAQMVFDRYIAPCSPRELESPRLHRLLNDPDIRQVALGGKGVGSQGDGCAQFCLADDASREELARLIDVKYGYRSFPATIAGDD